MRKELLDLLRPFAISALRVRPTPRWFRLLTLTISFSVAPSVQPGCPFTALLAEAI